jgi:tRNA threonylcarbamoyladenosine biosynthesis protein TsaB
VKVLAFDTATASTAVAFWDPSAGPEALLEARDDPGDGERPGHARRLLAMVAELIATGGGWGEAGRIAVGVGPGTFTGLRIGIATAHGLARARGLELVGVSTLRSLALRASLDLAAEGSAVLALIDARRGELFAAGWEAGDNPGEDAPRLGPCALPPERLAERLEELGACPLAVGEGALLHAPMLRAAGAVVPDADSELHPISALPHCRLGAEMVAGPSSKVQPQYLRVPDAELTRRAKA